MVETDDMFSSLAQRVVREHFQELAKWSPPLGYSVRRQYPGIQVHVTKDSLLVDVPKSPPMSDDLGWCTSDLILLSRS